jgi:hypothetical protein
MPDSLADSSARLRRLLEQVAKESDPEKCAYYVSGYIVGTIYPP